MSATGGLGQKNISAYRLRKLSEGWDADKIDLLIEWRRAYERHLCLKGRAMLRLFEWFNEGAPRSVRMLNTIAQKEDSPIRYLDKPLKGHNGGPPLDF